MTLLDVVIDRSDQTGARIGYALVIPGRRFGQSNHGLPRSVYFSRGLSDARPPPQIPPVVPPPTIADIYDGGGGGGGGGGGAGNGAIEDARWLPGLSDVPLMCR